MTRRPGTAGALLAGLALLHAAAAPAQEPSELLDESFLDSTEVSAILVPVTVKDRRGRLVANLESESFSLYVDDIQFPIRSFWREGGLPLSISFVLDTSGSMGVRRLSRAKQVILDFAGQLRGKDEACLITFGAEEVLRRLPFGADHRLLGRILEPLKGFGTTALYDVVYAAPQLMEGASHVRRATLFFTDGVDTASRLGPENPVKVLERLSDPLYVFGIEPPPGIERVDDSYEALLKRYAAASGGRYIRVENVAELPRIGRELRQELTMRYIIDILPSGVGAVQTRRLTVKVDGAYQVQARQTYRGTLP